LEEDLDEVTRRLAGLEAGRETSEAKSRVAEWRAVEPWSDFVLPLPGVVHGEPSLQGGWAEGGGPAVMT